MISQRELLSLLLSNALLSPATLLAGPFEIVDASRRNRNFIVKWNGGGFFAKCGQDEDGGRTVAHEAAFYDFAWSDPQCATCRNYLPGKAAELEDGLVLLLDLVDGTSFREHFTRGRISTAPAVRVAQFLATLHDAVRLSEDRGRFEAAISDRAPFGLTFDQPDRAVLHSSSAAAIELLHIVQASAVLCDGLAHIRSRWSVECLIHGDMRWDNCMLGFEGSRTRLSVIDWELAVYGDPLWDVAAMLAEHVGFWLQSVPIVPDDDAGQGLSAARYPLHKLTSSAAAFWSAYLDARQFDAGKRGDVLQRVMGYTAARLVQSAFEWANVTSLLPNHSVLALQLAENILLRPRAAAATLFGIVDEPELARCN